MENKKEHWENVYAQKKLIEVSWYEHTPETSLSIISNFNLPNEAAIIDIGGGDSLLVDHLLDLGYSDITVLDISDNALERAKFRLGNSASFVNWITSDILELSNDVQYDLWHDRAAFHFLTDEADQKKYAAIAANHLHTGGLMLISTFALNGPEKCSGLPVARHSETSLTDLFLSRFQWIGSTNHSHLTPFSTEQVFTYNWFRKI
ncbi:class I SAM-dependent methyltransferase [Mucilaginibacter gossypii]|uniref:class I SAM-dependent methyltransferase n=1 Tax=Mucilaginibacter gossypii TaxID=551996 RepID=UPI000DCB3EDD|nr:MULTISPECIES: class I SAM-dependent methyltransferase [Mucilaginibacter]QTE36335.1 class I SAM-dependent methyltransferase [Mucilaginibacter gossypii]RAV60077.1 SAM-dependent methyltransferase [Mucilaginibacter rubeus]